MFSKNFTIIEAIIKELHLLEVEGVWSCFFLKFGQKNFWFWSIIFYFENKNLWDFVSFAFDISFPTTLCMLKLKIVWRCYDEWNESGSTIKMWTLNKHQHIILRILSW